MPKRPTYRNFVDARPARPKRKPKVAQGGTSSLRRFLRFTGTSLTCTALDQVVAGLLFVMLRKPMGDKGFFRILVATAVARVISQTLNYALNRRLVFSGTAKGEGKQYVNRPSRRESIPRFLAVAAVILTLSTIGVYLLHDFFDLQESIAKLIMDSALFFLNYHLQHNWVFTTEPSIRPHRTKRNDS